MAIRCDDCRYLFSKKRVSCPFCGGQTIPGRPPRRRPAGRRLHHGSPRPEQQTIPDDPFEAMLRAYQRNRPSPSPRPCGRAVPAEQPQDGVDFFSHFQGGSPAADIPTVESTRRSQPQQEPPRRQPTQPDPYEAELREIERQQRRLERQYRRAAFWDRLSSFRWGSVFRVVVFVLVVLAAIGLWNMRYTILNSVIDLVIGILPVVLLIWGIWLLIRSIFR